MTPPTEGESPEEWADAVQAATMGVSESPPTEGGGLSVRERAIARMGGEEAYRAYHRNYERARRDAVKRLVAAHRSEYKVYLAEELGHHPTEVAEP